MHLILTASKDAYITNKIINSSFRAIDANTGRAGTLDLFKLYNETTFVSESTPSEISRILVKFDLEPIHEMTGTSLNLNSSNFKCFLSMKSAETGHYTPSNFRINVFPLSRSWDEGSGRDIGSFSDLDVCNFITASYQNGTVYPWFATGASKVGLLGSENIDIISSGNLGAGIENIFTFQDFEDGKEDLYVDVTKIVSATIAGKITDHGVRLSFTTSEEQDQKTRFVKRFFSRHVSNFYHQPTIRVLFDDSIRDDHSSFYFNTTGTLFISNSVRGKNEFIRSGSNLSVISGQDCLLLKISTGSYFNKIVNASSHVMSTTKQPLQGLYSASFCIAFTDSSMVISGTQNKTLYDIASASGSITFKTSWCSLDQTVVYHTGTLVIEKPKVSGFNSFNQDPNIRITNLRQSYTRNELIRFRLFGRNLDKSVYPPVKLPVAAKSEYFDAVHYRIKDSLTNEIIVPFDKAHNSTKASSDGNGLFFDFKMSSLAPGKNYYFEFLVRSGDREHVDTNNKLSFRVTN